MDENRFWQLIDDSRTAAGGDVKQQCRVLEDRLAALPPAEIHLWDAYFIAWERVLELDKLWSAAALFGDGCSDDGFQYFKRWVMAHGREVVAGAMGDPDSVASLLAGEPEGPELECLSAASEAYRRATGEDLPEEIPAVAIEAPAVEDWPEELDFYDDRDELERRLPRVAALARARRAP